MLAAASALASACDIKDTQHYQNTIGPTVRVIATNIDPATGEIPSDDVIQISFDRYLLPSTTIRQSFAIADNTNKVLPADGFQTVYDPVARTITIAGPQGPGVAWLTEGLEYKLVLFVPPNNETDIAGFRAIDRAPLEKNQNLTFVFKAGKAKGGPVRPIDPPVNFCADVLPILAIKCADPTCHGPPTSPTGGTQPAASLILTNSRGVALTAVDRVAQGANTGGGAFDPEPSGRVFGVDMAIVRRGNPGESWLMYKIEMAPHPNTDAGPYGVDGGPPPIKICTPPKESDAITTPGEAYTSRAPIVRAASDAERERLADFILGRWMPYPSSVDIYETQPLTFEERENVRRWIAQGAPTPDCGGCDYFTPLPEAGAPDASTDTSKPKDAGAKDGSADGGDAGDGGK